MKHNQVDLKEYDSRFKGRMNPRDTFHCDLCDKYYNGKSDITLMFDEEDVEKGDCVHGDDVEITESIYNSHIADLKAHGFLEEDNEM